MQINTNIFALLATALFMPAVAIAIYEAGREIGMQEERENQKKNRENIFYRF